MAKIKQQKELSYDTAYLELNTILEKLQTGQIGLDDLSIQLKRAIELTNYCKEKLRTLEEDLALLIDQEK
jgi:exodeoxyribonuclease VII small subunit